MARDYKHRAQPKAARRSAGWVWLLAGYLLGAFSVGLVWLELTPAEHGRWIGAEPEAAAAGPVSEPPTARPPKPRFDFYTLLPSMEVVVPEEELVEPEAAPAQAPSAPASPAVAAHYLLQVGSFRKAADAERLKAELALLGLSSQIQRVETQQRGVWHRVRAGPYRDMSEVRTVRERLEGNGHRTLVLQATP